MDELINDFIIEVTEGLVQLDSELIKLELNPDDQNLVRSIFRIIHTIKGTCGFLGLQKLESVTHAAENVLSKLRDKEIGVSSEIINVILETVDFIKIIVESLKTRGVEPDDEVQDLINKLNELVNVPATNAKNLIKPDTSDSTITSNQLTSPTAILQHEAIVEGLKVSESLAEHPDHPTSLNTIRVNLNLLENLMQTVSELVLTRNQLLQLIRSNKESKFVNPIQRLNLLTSELQDKIMKTRMQPISNAWLQFPRMIRDLALELNKKIKLQMIGGETELDRQLIEAIKDPLIHMVRNAASHGIESADERVKAGKPEYGTVTLKAYHQGGHIIVEVSDDGTGLNIEKIKNKILKNALLSEAELKNLNEQQISQYIFRPGFSTAENITSVSGRGVGMDIVKSNISNINGTISLTYIPLQGSTFTIKIPLTLAIIPILIIECAEERFGIPQINVVEIVRAGNHLEHKIEYINNKQVLRLREAIIPLLSLSEIFKTPTTALKNFKITFIVICEVGGYHFGVTVDRVYDTEEIVVKPVVPILRSLDIYFGTTLLGDGTVIMILDPNGLINFLDNFDIHNKFKILDHIKTETEEDSLVTSFLILKNINGPSQAIPLELVTRLEEIDVSKITYSADRILIQYHDHLMHLVKLDPEYKIPESGLQQIIVFHDQDKLMGLVVEKIIDIVEYPMTDFTPVKSGNIIGTIVINGITTDLIDVSKFFFQIFGAEYNNPLHYEDSMSNNIPDILLIDNSHFFRKFIFSVLKHHGYNVLEARTKEQANELLAKHTNFKLIIADAHTFDLSDSKLSTEYQNFAKYNNVPVIILSSTPSINKTILEQDQNIKAWIYKTNHSQLINMIDNILIQDKPQLETTL